jgi:hypothetical protein
MDSADFELKPEIVNQNEYFLLLNSVLQYLSQRQKKKSLTNTDGYIYIGESECVI